MRTLLALFVVLPVAAPACGFPGASPEDDTGDGDMIPGGGGATTPSPVTLRGTAASTQATGTLEAILFSGTGLFLPCDSDMPADARIVPVSDGAYEFSDVAPGNYTLEVVRTEGGNLEMSRQLVTVSGTEMNLELRLPPMVDLIRGRRPTRESEILAWSPFPNSTSTLYGHRADQSPCDGDRIGTVTGRGPRYEGSVPRNLYSYATVRVETELQISLDTYMLSQGGGDDDDTTAPPQ